MEPHTSGHDTTHIGWYANCTSTCALARNRQSYETIRSTDDSAIDSDACKWWEVMVRDSSKRQAATPATTPTREISTLLGQPLHNDSGAALGTIADVVVDLTAGHVTHLVVRAGGSTTYIPWRSVTIGSFGLRNRERLSLTHRHRHRRRP
jgi:sporulation protein YlmC with PRC-barrel domain